MFLGIGYGIHPLDHGRDQVLLILCKLACRGVEELVSREGKNHFAEKNDKGIVSGGKRYYLCSASVVNYVSLRVQFLKNCRIVIRGSDG